MPNHDPRERGRSATGAVKSARPHEVQISAITKKACGPTQRPCSRFPKPFEPYSRRGWLYFRVDIPMQVMAWAPDNPRTPRQIRLARTGSVDASSRKSRHAANSDRNQPSHNVKPAIHQCLDNPSAAVHHLISELAEPDSPSDPERRAELYTGPAQRSSESGYASAQLRTMTKPRRGVRRLCEARPEKGRSSWRGATKGGRHKGA